MTLGAHWSLVTSLDLPFLLRTMSLMGSKRKFKQMGKKISFALVLSAPSAVPALARDPSVFVALNRVRTWHIYHSSFMVIKA